MPAKNNVQIYVFQVARGVLPFVLTKERYVHGDGISAEIEKGKKDRGL